MVFKDKLNLLMETLDASGTQIAAFAGFDRSNISHFRRGSKTPKPSGRTARKLVLGLCRYAESKGMKETLCSIAGTSPDLSEEVLCRKLSGWLFEGLLDPAADKNSAGGTGRVIAFQSFADRLDAAMTLASLSNIRLSQMICVDASLISRYRSGERSPRSNPDLAAQISEILWQRIQKNEKMPELLQLMHTSGGEVSENEFANWLCQFDTPIDSGASSAEKLLKKFDSYSAEISFPLPSFSEAAPESVLRSRKDRYDGTEGLRTAVIRFLGNVVLSGARELYLYSDQNMEWMTGDQEFLMKWAALMSACVKNGVRIRPHAFPLPWVRLHQCLACSRRGGLRDLPLRYGSEDPLLPGILVPGASGLLTAPGPHHSRLRRPSVRRNHSSEGRKRIGDQDRFSAEEHDDHDLPGRRPGHAGHRSAHLLPLHTSADVPRLPGLRGRAYPEAGVKPR